MNVIFLTMSRITDISQRGIYTDLMRKFRDEGHSVYIVTPNERSFGRPTELKEMDGIHVLGVKTLNLQKTSVIEKGLGQVLVEGLYKRAIERYFGHIQFDIILYSTPPITFTNVVKYLKRKCSKAISYLLLKDIFPQNAVDIGMFGKYSIFNWYFRRKEVALYKTSDYFGCMSPANVKFILDHNDFINPENVEVAPNSLELVEELSPSDERAKRSTERDFIRYKYNLPRKLPIFIYGGNLGKPQGIDFLIKCLDANKERKDCYFVVVGNGTEYKKLAVWYNENESLNVKLMSRLPKEDYDMLVRSCDVGLIFLDHRFTIPNFPSRLLSYLEYKMPVLCATDVNTDMGRIAEENGFGYWCESVNPEDFTTLVDKILASDRKTMGEKGYEFLKANYLVQNTYDVIIRHCKG